MNLFLVSAGVVVCEDSSLTHAVFHHHEAALVTFEALAFKVSSCIDTSALSTQVWRDAALVDVCKKEIQQDSVRFNFCLKLSTFTRA